MKLAHVALIVATALGAGLLAWRTAPRRTPRPAGAETARDALEATIARAESLATARDPRAALAELRSLSSETDPRVTALFVRLTGCETDEVAIRAYEEVAGRRPEEFPELVRRRIEQGSWRRRSAAVRAASLRALGAYARAGDRQVFWDATRRYAPDEPEVAAAALDALGALPDLAGAQVLAEFVELAERVAGTTPPPNRTGVSAATRASYDRLHDVALAAFNRATGAACADAAACNAWCGERFRGAAPQGGEPPGDDPR